MAIPSDLVLALRALVLAAVLTGRRRCPIFPRDFPSDDPRFEPRRGQE
jgi:hypothetical protein